MKEKKNFYKSVLLLVVPMALQNLINVAVQSADVIMLGKLENSEIALSASSLAGQVCFILNLIFFGLTSGVSVLVAQYWGKKDKTSIEIIWGIAMRMALLIGCIFTIVTFVVPEPIMKIFSSDGAVIQAGAQYLRVVCISYIFIAFTMIYLNVMRSMENVMIATIIYTISLFINIFFNYIFIFGKLGCPKMGIIGAACGTVIARISEFIMTLIYNKGYQGMVKFQFSMLLLRSRELAGDFIHFSMPVVLNELMWGSGMAMTAAILGNMGSAVSSASAVVQVVRQLSMVLGLGIASAAAVMIGKVIGEGKMTLAKDYGKRFLCLGAIAGCLGIITVLIARPITLFTMNLEGQARECLGYMMYLMSIYVFFQAVSTTCIVGIFRAGGDTRFGLIVDMSCLWGVSILGGYLAAFVFQFNVEVVYIIILLDEIVKLPFVIWRYRSYVWLKDVTRN